MKKKLTSTSPLKLLKGNSTLLLMLTIMAVYGYIASALYGGDKVDSPDYAVRPAMWISLK